MYYISNSMLNHWLPNSHFSSLFTELKVCISVSLVELNELNQK